MQSLTLRQINFIKLILLENEYRTLNYFAQKLDVSSKTLQNDLKIISKILNKYNIKINSKRGVGICIDKEAKKNIKFLNDLNGFSNNKDIEISVENRRMEILINFLLKSDLKTSINKLSEKYFVSKTSIVNDLKYIEEWLNNKNLYLNKDLNGTYISGKEVDIRKAIASLIEEILKEDKEDYNLNIITRIEKSTFKDLIKVFDIESITYIENCIKDLEKDLQCEICEPYYINLITHILICIKRIKEGNLIKNSEEEIEVFKNKKIYKSVRKLTNAIESKYDIVLDNQEIYYIYKYIVSSRLDENYNIKEIEFNEDFSKDFVYEMVNIMSEFLNMNLKSDILLKKGLLIHVKPMINRLNYDIQIKNPIKKEIIKEFNEIFNLIRLTINIMNYSYNIKDISDDEIAYLTTYFQAAIERNFDRKKVLIVCHSGYGTSQFLASKIKQKFPKIEIVDIISSRKLNNEIIKKVDFIISTVNIEETSKDCIIVSALLTEVDINNIKELIDKPMYKKDNFSYKFLLNELEKFKNNKINNFEAEKFDFGKNICIYVNKKVKKNEIFLNIEREIAFYINSSEESYLKKLSIDIYRLYKNNSILKLIKCLTKE